MNAERDHDRLLEAALGHELSADAAASATDACLDAETVAAWMDGGLDAQAIVMAEAHAANCVRCQALLGTVARTTPVIAVAAPRGAGLWRWWFAPLAASAAAATVWMVVPQEPVERLVSAPVVTTPGGQATPPESSVAQSEPVPRALPAPGEQRGRREMAGDRAESAPPALAKANEPKRDAQRLEVLERKAEAPKLADHAAEGRIAAAPAAPPAAALRKQTDAAADVTATARSTPSPTVIWIVGRAGLVQLATDGRTFVRLPFPEAVDLTAVTAKDERHATVTTADGRTFETADAGRTWRLR